MEFYIIYFVLTILAFGMDAFKVKQSQSQKIFV